MQEGETEEAEIRNMSKKELRKQYSTGFIQLATPSSVPLLIDATLDMPPEREFTKSELASKAGLSTESVRNHISKLEGLGFLKTVPDSSPQRFKLNRETKIATLLFELDKVIGETKAGEPINDDFISVEKSSQSIGDHFLEVDLPQESDFDTTARIRSQVPSLAVAGD
jgi:DNA-binding transcriptional ArsR family regulator